MSVLMQSVVSADTSDALTLVCQRVMHGCPLLGEEWTPGRVFGPSLDLVSPNLKCCGSRKFVLRLRLCHRALEFSLDVEGHLLAHNLQEFGLTQRAIGLSQFAILCHQGDIHPTKMKLGHLRTSPADQFEIQPPESSNQLVARQLVPWARVGTRDPYWLDRLCVICLRHRLDARRSY